MWWRKDRHLPTSERKAAPPKYLNKSKSIAIPKRRKTGRSAKLKLTGASGHNCKTSTWSSHSGRSRA